MTVVLGKVILVTLLYWCNNGSFKIYFYFACLQRSFIQQGPSVSGCLVFSWTFLWQTCFLQISMQILIIILYISSVSTSVKSMSQLVLNRSASILAQLMSSLKRFKSLELKLLFLIWWFCFSSTIFMFISI